MKTGAHNYILVALSTVLFFAFSMMHEFDWLIPANPVASVVASSPMPVPDIVEESVSEDEIEHEDAYQVISYYDRHFFRISLAFENSYIPSVPLPPPDMA